MLYERAGVSEAAKAGFGKHFGPSRAPDVKKEQGYISQYSVLLHVHYTSCLLLIVL